ncbi:3-deoxy-D-manno-octulosonate 8-phosphate phosphatase [Sphingobacteriales bacterium UPWRP_1]|nr:3-deoxy-D-manno-octulosonate 8-phosphate phosphatase [Sphingobacteriales bacterium TSM_CSS]PSJ76978.1 3-deoxy-D-manno-octulosonate 8-phosphate phosphatase [Sphingobacteriales bacterium UPWRP_1]
MDILTAFANINTLIFDVDGVLTNGNVLITEQGHLLRAMNVRDGYAIRHALQAGLHIAIITGGNSDGVTKRLQMLGITDIYANVRHKPDAFEELVLTYNLNKNQILYMGDDLPDWEVMRQVAMPVCPADAVPEIKSISKYISPYTGGNGCVRDVIEKTLKLKGLWA